MEIYDFQWDTANTGHIEERHGLFVDEREGIDNGKKRSEV